MSLRRLVAGVLTTGALVGFGGHSAHAAPAGAVLPPGAVAAADVGAPSGTQPLAPSLRVSAPSVLAAATGGAVLAYGTAPDDGSVSGEPIAAPVVGIAPMFDGGGYWLVAADGGIFTFGDAHFYGSTGAVHLNEPIVGMAATPTGNGYWLVAADGGIFTFGGATFDGSAAGQALEQPVVGMAATATGAGYWLAEGQREGPALEPAGLFSPALVGALNQRAGIVSAAIVDLTSGESYQYRPGQPGVTASIVKVEILGTLLREAQAAGRSLTPTEQSVATSMIEFSDNGSATQLWNEVGGAPAVAAFDRSVGMGSTSPAPAWGLTVTTAADQVALLEHLVLANPVLSTASRTDALALMEHVTPSQGWGVSAGSAPGTTVALKNGWLPVGAGWTVNSIGWVSGFGRNYLIAVTTSGDPSESYGIASISMVAGAAWATLGH